MSSSRAKGLIWSLLQCANLSVSLNCGLNTGARVAASLLTKPTSTGNLCSFIPRDANDLMSYPPAFRQFSHFLNIFLDTWKSFYLEPLAILLEDLKYLEKKKHGLPTFDLNSQNNRFRTNPPQRSDFVSWKKKTLTLWFSAQSRNSKLMERELRQLYGNCRNAMVHIVSSYNRVYINHKQLRSDSNTPNFICF